MAQIKLLVITLLLSSFVFLMINVEAKAKARQVRSSINFECSAGSTNTSYPIPEDPLPLNVTYLYYDLSFFNGLLLNYDTVLSGHSTIIDVVCFDLLHQNLSGTIEFPTLNLATWYKLDDGHFLSLPNGTWVDVVGDGRAEISIGGAKISATARAHINLIQNYWNISNLEFTLDNLDSISISADNFTANGQLVNWSEWNQVGVLLVKEYFNTYKYQVERGMEQLTNLILSNMTLEQICEWLYHDEELCGWVG